MEPREVFLIKEPKRKTHLSGETPIESMHAPSLI